MIIATWEWGNKRFLAVYVINENSQGREKLDILIIMPIIK